jgi:hypothetical protein
MATRQCSRAPWLAVAAAIVCTCATSMASASPQYPNELRAALGLDYTPKCTLCHSSADGGTAGPADTPFGSSMLARGSRGESSQAGDAGAGDAGYIDPTLLAALAAMRRDDVDSDGDGATDLDELSWGSDPNVFDGLRVTPVPPPHYGCQMDHASGSKHAGWAVCLGLLALAARRRAH